MLAFAVLVEDPEQWVVVVAKVECNLLSSPDYAVEHNSKFDKNKIYNCRWTVNGVVGKDAHKAYIYPVDIIIIVLPPLYHRHTKGSVTGVVLKKLYDTPKSFYLNHHSRFVFNLYVSATLHDFASPGLDPLFLATRCDFNQSNHAIQVL